MGNVTVILREEFRTEGLVIELVGYQKAHWEIGRDTEEISEFKNKSYVIQMRDTLLTFENNIARPG